MRPSATAGDPAGLPSARAAQPLSTAGHELLAQLWAEFVRSAPQAARICELLADRGEHVHHHHIALRTFASPAIGIDAVASRFEAEGWRPRQRYHLAEAHLRARYWKHDDPNAPRIFISELDPSSLSPRAREIIDGLLAQVPDGFGARPDLAWAGRPWTLSFGDYQALAAESEHAAWIAALGLRVAHMTLDVGALITFPDLPALVAFLAEHALRIDTVRGAASTRADAELVRFTDASARVAGSRYELADLCFARTGET